MSFLKKHQTKYWQTNILVVKFEYSYKNEKILELILESGVSKYDFWGWRYFNVTKYKIWKGNKWYKI